MNMSVVKNYSIENNMDERYKIMISICDNTYTYFSLNEAKNILNLLNEKINEVNEMIKEETIINLELNEDEINNILQKITNIELVSKIKKAIQKHKQKHSIAY